jgi:hypothetical protein
MTLKSWTKALDSLRYFNNKEHSIIIWHWSPVDVGGNGKLSYQVAVGWFGKLVQNFAFLFLKNPVHYKILLLDSESVTKHPHTYIYTFHRSLRVTRQ